MVEFRLLAVAGFWSALAGNWNAFAVEQFQIEVGYPGKELFKLISAVGMDEMGSVRSEHVYELAKTHRKNIESISDASAAQEVGDRSSRSTAEFRFKLAHRVQDFMSRFGTPPLDGDLRSHFGYAIERRYAFNGDRDLIKI